MDNKQDKTAIKEDTKPEFDLEIVEDEFDELDVESLLPTMNVNTEVPQEKESIVKDEVLLDLYDEILQDCRDDRTKADEILANFLEMVINDGDASSASKEAIVNLMKIRSDISDKKSKIADLKTRIKLKEKDTFPRFLAAQQNNKVVIEGSQRDLLKSINKIAINNKKGKPNDA